MFINQNIKAYLCTFFSILMWGITFISTKILLRDFSPIEILFSRFLLGFALLLIIYRKNNKIHTKKEEILFALTGLSGITLYYLFENIALNYSLASNVGILVAIGPLFTGIFASVFLKEKLKINFFIGFIFAIIGIFVIAFNGKFILKINPIGDMFAVLAAVMWGIYSVLVKKIADLGYNSVLITKKTFMYGIIFMLPAMLFMGFDVNINDYLKPINLINFLFLSFIACTLCFITWAYSIKILGAVRTNTYIYFIPIITLIASKIILDENITVFAVVGIVFILLGVIISQANISFKKMNKINTKKIINNQ
ncbi:EamA family transporter [Brachyspira hampsonii]|uniref:EamA family transporter n=1 Tax=Brachyspira hampsonii TaxID=1287055 RepID=A0AAC9TU83_9SPIR|nr:DMT family transporter [Brachyspira hampsonii]ASJ21993.1 EamA family transporter [Brachyspira hampsonii]MBW5411330.1 DMT family transporter [Brachyspira hampsonii]OEJ19558.1 multidrug transporter [Brachyspira hampsonii]